MQPDAIQSLTTPLRLDVLGMIDRAQVGCTGSALAYVEALAVLYFGEENGRRLLKVDPAKPQWQDRDYVILSDMNATPVWYACLARAGFFDENDLTGFAGKGSQLTANPGIKVPGVEATVGTPGKGLSIGQGVARALAIEQKKNHVFVVFGDRDLEQGQLWEAAMSAAYQRLDRLVGICVHTGLTKVKPVQDKFEAFGWKVIKVMNGHNIRDLIDAVGRSKEVSRCPTLILAPSVFGKGVPFAEGKAEYEDVVFSEQERNEALLHLQKHLT